MSDELPRPLEEGHLLKEYPLSTTILVSIGIYSFNLDDVASWVKWIVFVLAGLTGLIAGWLIEDYVRSKFKPELSLFLLIVPGFAILTCSMLFLT